MLRYKYTGNINAGGIYTHHYGRRVREMKNSLLC